MHSIDLRSNNAPDPAVQHAPVKISGGWLLRRAALWILILALGIAASCLLYMAASKAEAEALSRTQAVSAPFRG